MSYYDFDSSEPDYEPEEISNPGAYVNGAWTDVEDLPRGWGKSPEWWDDEAFGETYEEYMEHED